MYGEVVEGIDAHRFESALTDLKEERGVQQDVELDANDLRELVGTYKRIYEGRDGLAFPQDAREQLGRAVRAVFESWDTPRAQVYRRAHRIPDDLGTAVNVVQMVFGNKGAGSGTGVAFTRDPSTGESGLFGEFLADAQGEDVVAGIRTPEPIEAMRDRLPEAFDQLLETMRRLEANYRDMQDIEFTVEDGRLYLLQTRSAKRTAAAALQGRRDHDRRGADLARGGGRANRPGPARPAPPPTDRPERGAGGRRARVERLAGRGLRQGGARRRPRRGARARGRERDPRPLGDDTGRHPRPDPGERES
jgi:pyruvate,orthophosphate dikinase